MLISKKILFASGVPDSLLAPFCTEIINNSKITHITAANEGNAVALACGYNLSTGAIPLVYMQNSGLGNIINPLLSLMDKNVYNIPTLYIIGWRGEPSHKDEPQHITQGILSEPILKAIDLKYKIISSETDFTTFESYLSEALNFILTTGEAFAFLIKKGSFTTYENHDKKIQKFSKKFLRRDALNAIINALPKDTVIISTTGKTSRELYEIRNERNDGHKRDFLTVGSMGHSSQIALSISLFKKNASVCCIDGEGAVLMHMGALVINGALANDNFTHIVINNGSHDSVGGQANFGGNIDFSKIALACGYKNANRVNSPCEIFTVLNSNNKGSVFLQIDVDVGSNENLSRPKESPSKNKRIFIEYLKDLNVEKTDLVP